MSKDVNILVDHLLRHNSGKMVAVLTRIFGLHQIDAIEDAIQDSLVKALNLWPYRGIPDNPSAWLIQVAKNSLFDHFRRENRSVSLDHEIREADKFVKMANDPASFEAEISEDQLRMIFACCHPSIPKDSQVALTLKIVGGFNNREIASAFLAKRTAIDKMLVRAKQKLKQHRKGFGLPEPEKVSDRLEAVLKVIYLMFNEGYMASEGPVLIKEDLCFEAIRLIRLLAEHPLTNTPSVNALAALLHLQASRLASRSGSDGVPALLADQDRENWDKTLIWAGVKFLAASAKGEELTEYHIEAEIASHHVLAEDFDSTDWPAILESYERLLEKRRSPIVALNRAYALGKVEGAERALECLAELPKDELSGYYPYHLTYGEFLSQTGHTRLAEISYRKVLDLTKNEAVRSMVKKKLGSSIKEVSA